MNLDSWPDFDPQLYPVAWCTHICKKLDENRHRSTPLCKVIVSGRYEMENNVHVEEQGQGRGSQVPSDGPITMRPVDRRSSPSTRVSHEPSTREEEGVLKQVGGLGARCSLSRTTTKALPMFRHWVHAKNNGKSAVRILAPEAS